MTTQKGFDGRRSILLKRLGKRLEQHIRRASVPARDWLSNRGCATHKKRFLVVRHFDGLPSYYKHFLRWMARRLPEVRPLFELRLLPYRVRNWSDYGLLVPWLPDTFLYRNAAARDWANALTRAADEHSVPVINRPDRLLSTSKDDCARQIAQLGVRTPLTQRITSPAAFRRDLGGMKLPLLVRENLAHGGWSPVYLVEKEADLAKIPLEQFDQPIAVEFIDVRNPADGLVRKYRYMAMGEVGIAHTLQISQHWEVRSAMRLLTQATRDEELAYTANQDPNHELLQRVRQGLGLDFLAFDYSYDRQGQLIIWEVNVLPGLGIPSGEERAYFVPAIERAMAATVKMMLTRARLEVPPAVDDILGENCSSGIATLGTKLQDRIAVAA